MKELFATRPEYSGLFQSSLLMHTENMSAKLMRHSVWKTSLSPYCILMVTSLQKFITYSRNEQKALIVHNSSKSITF